MASAVSPVSPVPTAPCALPVPQVSQDSAPLALLAAPTEASAQAQPPQAHPPQAQPPQAQALEPQLEPQLDPEPEPFPPPKASSSLVGFDKALMKTWEDENARFARNMHGIRERARTGLYEEEAVSEMLASERGIHKAIINMIRTQCETQSDKELGGVTLRLGDPFYDGPRGAVTNPETGHIIFYCDEFDPTGVTCRVLMRASKEAKERAVQEEHACAEFNVSRNLAWMPAPAPAPASADHSFSASAAHFLPSEEADAAEEEPGAQAGAGPGAGAAKGKRGRESDSLKDGGRKKLGARKK